MNKKIRLDKHIALSKERYQALKKGFKPRSKEDKWNLNFENETLFCYRASDNHLIYEMSFEYDVGMFVTSKILVEGDRNFYDFNPELEVYFIMLLIESAFGEFSNKKNKISGLLEFVSFNELDEKFGVMLY